MTVADVDRYPATERGDVGKHPLPDIGCFSERNGDGLASPVSSAVRGLTPEGAGNQFA